MVYIGACKKKRLPTMLSFKLSDYNYDTGKVDGDNGTTAQVAQGGGGGGGGTTLPTPTKAGQVLTAGNGGTYSWKDLPEYLINDESTITLAANVAQTVTTTKLANIDSFKVLSGGSDITDNLTTTLTSPTTLSVQSSTGITVKVELIGPPV